MEKHVGIKIRASTWGLLLNSRGPPSAVPTRWHHELLAHWGAASLQMSRRTFPFNTVMKESYSLLFTQEIKNFLLQLVLN